MAIKNKSLLFAVSLLGGVAFYSNTVEAYTITANEIYRQARQGNYSFFQRLARYNGAVNMQNRFGDTAYCVAMRYDDAAAQELLLNYGADAHHPCVKQINEEKEQYARREAQANQRRRTANSSFENDSGNNYLWWGLGALAVGGGVAALASGGGGGGGSHSDGNTSGGNTGGGTGEGSGGGDTGGGDSSGGDDSGNLPSDPSTAPTISADVFRTEEYNNSNYLEGIKAAGAYSYMYTQGENGELISHQANSDAPLEKVKVGVIDTGVYTNKDLDGKIVGGYDLNPYNNMGNIRGYMASPTQHFYIFQQGDKYYIVGAQYMTDEGAWGISREYATDNRTILSHTYEELDDALKAYGLSLDQFTVMNGSGGSTPGSDYANAIDINDIYSLWNAVADLNHGTHVAGLIAANKNDEGSHGVAFENGEIVAVSWDLSSGLADTVKKMVDEDDVRVFSNSWGSASTADDNATDAKQLLYQDMDTMRAYAHVANNGGVWVQAAGNEGQTEPGKYAGIGGLNLSLYGYNGPGKYEVPFLAVTALDYSTRDANAPSGYLDSSYANWCGSASRYCLAAPGTEDVSTGAVQDGVFPDTGTSMSTPVVSGSIALLMGYYPWLSAQNVAYILLETANDEGEYANDQKYGQGALDLEAAVTTPIDGLRLASSSSFDSLTPVGVSKLSLSSSMQNKILKALPKTVTAFDALNRPFEYDTKNLVNETHASNANFRNAVSRMAMGGAKKTVKDEKTGFAFTSSESLNNGGQANLASMEVVSETDAGETRFYYAQNSKYDTPDSVLTPSNNPYLAMNEAYGAENTMKLSDTSKFKLALQTGENGLYERDYEQDNHSFTERSYAFSGEYSFNMTDYLELATMGGMLMENDALLGMNGTGGFGIKDSSTYYMGIRAALNLTPNLSLIAAYYRGYTQGADTPMLAISDLQTESFMVAGEYKLNAKDKVGLSFSSPLSVVKGRASLMYAGGRDNYSDTIYMNKLTTSLTPEAKEYDLGLYYQGEPKEDLSLMGKIQARFNADGEKGVTDYIGIVGMQSNF